MGFNLLSLANNHAFDLLESGLLATRAEVARLGFSHAGTGRNADQAAGAAILETPGGKVALVAMASGGAQLTPEAWAGPGKAGVNFLELKADGSLNSEHRERMLHAVREAAAKARTVIVYQHNHYWGEARGKDGPPGRERRIDRFETPGWMETWARELIDAGIDFIKDDELQADGPACPFDERVRLCMQVIRSHAERSGRKVMYAFNLTGELDEMRRRHDLVMAEGGTAVMLSLNSVGMSGFNAFRKHAKLPVHAHRNGWGYLQTGWSYVAWQKLWRLAGVDHMHVNGIANKFQEDDDSVITSARACLKPLFSHKPCAVMPVFSSGQTVMQAEPGAAAIPVWPQ